MQVIATAVGYIHGKIRRTGEEFDVVEHEFADCWMEKKAVPEVLETSKASKVSKVSKIPKVPEL